MSYGKTACGAARVCSPKSRNAPSVAASLFWCGARCAYGQQGIAGAGQLDEALKSYRDSLAIAERLAASDRSNTGWQHDLSVLYNSIGDVLVAQGKLDEALKSYRDSLAIAERLAASDRSNTGWQRDLSVLYEGIGALEEHKRFVFGRETRQRDEDRIRRFEEVQRRKRKWIKCGEIPVWISELGGSGPNEAARENAYTIVKEGLLARHFEENGRSQVLFLFPGVSFTRKMTPQRLQDAIDNDYDNQHGRSWVKNCWVPRNLLKRWCEWHHFPESPPRFQPSQEIRTPFARRCEAFARTPDACANVIPAASVEACSRHCRPARTAERHSAQRRTRPTPARWWRAARSCRSQGFVSRARRAFGS